MIDTELINASAGSGKTYSLTYRVVELIKNGIDPEALMVTTFTNKAAAELRSRIRSELLKNKQSDEANRINDGFIGTVNSICGYLLKEYALEAGLSPAIEVMPEEDSASIFKISIDRIIGKYAAQIEPVAKRMELDGRKNDKDWRDDVKRIVDLARSNGISAKDLQQCSEDSWQTLKENLGALVKGNLNSVLYEAMQAAEKDLDEACGSTKTTQTALNQLKEFIKKYNRNWLTWGDWGRLSKLKAAKAEQPFLEPVNIAADNVLHHPGFQSDMQQMIEGVFNCAIEALNDYDAYKKAHGLMDFTDQESKVLEMAINNEAFRESFSDRIDILMVDEFQDTSPIQLALFLTLNELAGKSLWVGDPKQAIYGFRGTDPQLMVEIVSLIKNTQVLDCSWRSKENLIEFTNAIFSEVFHEMGSEKVCLKVPEKRIEKAKGGCLETWYLTAKKKEQESVSVANGVRDLIERNPEIKPGDIAVLCRTNDNCISIAAYLENLGVRASVGQGLLLNTKECGLAVAALRYMNNKNDTLAMTEIVQIMAEYQPGEDWMTELMSDPEQFKERWQKDDLLASLNEGRNYIRYWTPLEALEQAISRIGLMQKVKSWSNPNLAMSNLDLLRKTCQEYINQCSSHRSTATIDGFVTYLQKADTQQAEGIGEDTVNVLTYHSSKGLEWPWVVLTDLNKEVRTDVFGVNIEAAQHFDPSKPLADRKIRFWPWPFGYNFGKRSGYPLLDEKIEDLQLYRDMEAMSEREAQRLLYVGMTRAKDGLVMAIRKKEAKKGDSLETGWLDVMKNSDGNKVILFDSKIGENLIPVGKSQIAIEMIKCGPESDTLPGLVTDKKEYLPFTTNSSIIYPAARVAPSKLMVSELETGKWEIIKRSGFRINIKGNPEMDLLGNAMHSFLAVDSISHDEQKSLSLAQEILKNWGLHEMIEATELAKAGKNWAEYIEQQYPGAKVYREWPMVMRNNAGQVIQGWIDLLIEIQDGYVIVDHKDYPGGDAKERSKKYIPQMKAYKEAVEKSTGKSVKDMLLHLPVSGLILRLTD